jgi:hypothetical protein
VVHVDFDVGGIDAGVLEIRDSVAVVANVA